MKKYSRKNSWPTAPVECNAHDTHSVSAINTGASTYHANRLRAGSRDSARLLASATAIISGVGRADLALPLEDDQVGGGDDEDVAEEQEEPLRTSAEMAELGLLGHRGEASKRCAALGGRRFAMPKPIAHATCSAVWPRAVPGRSRPHVERNGNRSTVRRSCAALPRLRAADSAPLRAHLPRIPGGDSGSGRTSDVTAHAARPVWKSRRVLRPCRASWQAGSVTRRSCALTAETDPAGLPHRARRAPVGWRSVRPSQRKPTLYPRRVRSVVARASRYHGVRRHR